MSDANCPYCNAEIELDYDDHGYAEGTNHDTTCPECEKAFSFTVHISVDFAVKKADCLNGTGGHKMKFLPSWPARYSRMGCLDCSLESQATPEEIQRHHDEGKPCNT
jgi:Zn ribbon nucleic-acid-binding protein